MELTILSHVDISEEVQTKERQANAVLVRPVAAPSAQRPDASRRLREKNLQGPEVTNLPVPGSCGAQRAHFGVKAIGKQTREPLLNSFAVGGFVGMLTVVDGKAAHGIQ